MSPSVHPLEQLRYVARGWEIGDEFPAPEVASILAELAGEAPATLLQACRRLIEYFPASGTVWWFSARTLSAPDPVEGIFEAADELADDPTAGLLANALPPSATVAVVGRSQPVATALRRRSDVAVHKRADRADIVVGTAIAAGPAEVLVGSRAGTVAGNAGRAGQEVWVVVPRGVALPGALWDQLLGRSLPLGTVATLAAGEVTAGVGDRGKAPMAEVLGHPTCPPVAELLGWKI